MTTKRSFRDTLLPNHVKVDDDVIILALTLLVYSQELGQRQVNVAGALLVRKYAKASSVVFGIVLQMLNTPMRSRKTIRDKATPHQ